MKILGIGIFSVLSLFAGKFLGKNLVTAWQSFSWGLHEAGFSFQQNIDYMNFVIISVILIIGIFAFIKNEVTKHEKNTCLKRGTKILLQQNSSSRAGS